jgi:hypothetical protein
MTDTPDPTADDLREMVRDAGYAILNDEQLFTFERDLLDQARQLWTARRHLQTVRRGGTAPLPTAGGIVYAADPRRYQTRVDAVERGLRAAVAALTNPTIPDARRIRVCHNNNHRDASTYGYRATDTVCEVFAYPVRDGDGHPLHNAFDMIEIGRRRGSSETDDRALAYATRGNRSLSIGDLVGVESRDGQTRWYAVGKAAFWLPLDRQPRFVQRAEFGTTPIDTRIDTGRPGRTAC